MFIALLGRQPELSHAELEAVFGASNVQFVAAQFATVRSADFTLDTLGGTLKYGTIIHELPAHRDDKSSLLAASKWILHEYHTKWRHAEGKITVGLSAYNLHVSPRDVQKTGLLLKSALKKDGVSLRLIPNDDVALSTATSHNNKLGSRPNKVELLIIRTHDNRLLIAQSHGTQNIMAYTRRDRERPRRDAFVGMLPPKLAQIMINLAIASPSEDFGGKGVTNQPLCILDPFCGTGTVLQEALIRGFRVIGSDLSEKMVAYTTENLAWVQQTHHTAGTIIDITQADAITHHWQHSAQIDAVVCETYLGQPFSAPPSAEKLHEVVNNCNHIISGFLQNVHDQLRPGTPLCLAVPAWHAANGHVTHLPLVGRLDKLGYQSLVPSDSQSLLYHRENQVVAREILLLRVK